MKTKVIVNGLPGSIPRAIAAAIIASDQFELLPISLTGPEIKVKNITISNLPVKLLWPEERNQLLTRGWPDVVIHFADNEGLEESLFFYEQNKLPFVICAGGVELKLIQTSVMKAGINAVYAHNFTKEMTAFQAMIEFAAKNFPEFKNYHLEVTGEKKRKASLNYKIPANFWNYSENCLYSLKKEDDSIFLQFNYRADIKSCVDGCLEAVKFLAAVKKFSLSQGKTYLMTDVFSEEYKKFK